MAGPTAARSAVGEAGQEPHHHQTAQTAGQLGRVGRQLAERPVLAGAVQPFAGRDRRSAACARRPGTASRAVTGGGAPSAPWPPSRMKPPCSKAPMPMPERLPRWRSRATLGATWRRAPASLASRDAQRQRQLRSRAEAGMGRDGPVDGHPNRRQAPGRGQPVEHRPAPLQLHLALDQERGRAARRASWVARPSTVKPRLPNRRPSPPSRSRKPRCRRAGA